MPTRTAGERLQVARCHACEVCRVAELLAHDVDGVTDDSDPAHIEDVAVRSRALVGRMLTLVSALLDETSGAAAMASTFRQSLQ
jgi:hypothetical protein